MAYFERSFLKFFRDLKENNHKEWFDKNRKVYDEVVKKPFHGFVDELIGRIHDDDPRVNIQAKDAIFRINRDIRFSPDKTPYKTQMSALISSAGRKDKTTPGMYIQFSAEDARIYSGIYMLDKNQLYSIRRHIATDLKDFRQLVKDKSFIEKFGGILGDKNKVIPPEFKPVFEQEPLIANKSFYYMSKFEPEMVLEDTLPDLIMELYHTAKPLNAFLTEGLEGKS